MKKLFIMAATLLLDWGVLFSGSIDNLSQQSADYIRKISKNGATTGIDIITYNPAGIQQIADGLHFQINAQAIFKKFSIEGAYPWTPQKNENFESTVPSIYLSSLYALYKKEQWSGFFAFTIPAGGGSLDYKDGVYVLPLLETVFQHVAGNVNNFAVTKNSTFKGSSIYYGGTLGGAFSFSNEFSISLAARYIYAIRTYDGKANFVIMNGATPVTEVQREIDAKRTASGIGFIIGANYKASSILNFGFRIESATNLKFKTDVNKMSPEWQMLTSKPPLNIFKDGAKIRRDLPWLLAFGVDYQLNSKFLLSTGINYYFITSCEGLDDNYENGYELQFAVENKLSKDLMISLGYNFIKVGGNTKTYYDFEYPLDSHLLTTGCKYLINKEMSISFALGKVFYQSAKSEKANYNNVEYKKDAWICSLGYEYSIR